MIRPALALCLTLAACGAGDGGWRPFGEARPGLELETDAGGLAIIGRRGERIDFGRAPSGVISVLDRELGPGRALGVAGCPAGVTQQISWGDLVLTFSDEQFVGWRGLSGAAGQVCG